ncbi:IS701 family transposase [Streptomyces sp. NPDC005930]|uniref:IS701 family transposase n=1 Tax=Streptomyces sp. NPDC005930 TaxID=3364736 RepID=UPI0036CD0618
MTTFAPAPVASVDSFADELFSGLPRADQRRWARIYLRGLLATPGKKSLRRIASAVAASPTASQSMHQFINVSPWEWQPVRDALARWVTARQAPEAYVLDLAYIPKRGLHSCGVHTRFVPQLGRSASCQVGLGLFMASARSTVPVDWQLHLPAPWLADGERRRTRVQDPLLAQSLEEQTGAVLASCDRWAGSRTLPVVADLTSHADSLHLVHAMLRRRQPFMVRVPPHTRLVTSQGAERDARSLTDRPDRGAALTFGAEQIVSTAPVWAPGRTPGTGGTFDACRVIAMGRGGDRARRSWWLTSLADERTDSLAALSALLTRSAGAITDMQQGLGLADFEGRSFPGWHHHMTIVSAAYAWQCLRQDPPHDPGA